ncbi:hypothetical protein WDU94_006700 [Cyamophila willieti]
MIIRFSKPIQDLDALRLLYQSLVRSILEYGSIIWSPRTQEPRGIIPLENIQVREVHDRHKPHCFELFASNSEFIKACKTDSEGKVVEGKHTVYRMSAATAEEKDEWIKC